MILEQHKQKVTISYSDNMTYNYKSVKIPFVKIMDLVKSNFNYSAGTFENGHRKADNYLNYSDLIILDIDEGLTIKEAKKIFCAFDYILATTKSHQKQKDKKAPCDRFRIILPTDTPITLNKEEYTQMMAEVHKEFNFVDTSCKDASRFYYPTKDAKVYIHGGFCNFYWEDYWEKAKQKQIEQKQKRYIVSNVVDYDNTSIKQGTNESKLRYLRKFAGKQEFLNYFKTQEKFCSGNRNTFLFSVAKHLQEIGMNDIEIKQNTLWVNSQGDSISDSEIEKTVFRSIKL